MTPNTAYSTRGDRDMPKDAGGKRTPMKNVRDASGKKTGRKVTAAPRSRDASGKKSLGNVKRRPRDASGK